MLGMYRLTVLVHSKKCDIQVVAGKLKIIGIAAKKRHLKFGRKDQPHVGVFFETIKMIQGAGVERDYIAADVGSGGTLFFDGSHSSFASSGGGSVVHAGADGSVDL